MVDELLLRTLTPAVIGVLVRRGADFAAAEDAVQDALIEAVRVWPDDVSCAGIPKPPPLGAAAQQHRHHRRHGPIGVTERVGPLRRRARRPGSQSWARGPAISSGGLRMARLPAQARNLHASPEPSSSQWRWMSLRMTVRRSAIASM
jgi:hypothetical protein